MRNDEKLAGGGLALVAARYGHIPTFLPKFNRMRSWSPDSILLLPF
jgi:hypothetical protein